MPTQKFREEGKFSEKLYSYVSTSLYDWAVSKKLHDSKVYCWAVIAGYYSIYIACSGLPYFFYNYFSSSNKKKIDNAIETTHYKVYAIIGNRLGPPENAKKNERKAYI